MKIYNSLTKQKELFKPLQDNKVRMYVCGMTVYDYCHIGHARSWIVFDIVLRYLRYRDYQVHFVKNITDIDDKIIKRAKERGISCDELTEIYIAAMREDEAALNIIPADDEPRATQYIPQIIQLVQQLIAKGYAYPANNGDVYFDVRRFKGYGKLSHRDLDELIAGARVEIGENKKDPLDFVLWKAAKEGEPHWPSPWGEGRPGWHIECSAMASSLLGQPFDIHGGGLDLKFPHHENEIAQSEAAEDKDFVKLWMHAGLLMVDNEKMAKSLGNFFTIRDVLKVFHPEVIRYFMLAAHYRSPVNYSKENMENIQQALSRLYLAIRGLPIIQSQDPIPSEFTARFQAAMDDDFNTPEALAVLFDMAKEINRLRENQQNDSATKLAQSLRQLSGLLGILQKDPEVFLKGEIDQDEADKIKLLINARNQARQERNWQEADRLRKELMKQGIVIEDTSQGTIWRRS